MDKDLAAYQSWAGGQGHTQLPKQYQQFITSAQPQTVKKPARTGIGSIIGGTLGGIGGAALGSFIPGAGTIAGGIAGGAGGSALGEALDQLITGGHISSGKQILEESALGAAPGALGAGFKAVKGARAGMSLAETLAAQGAKTGTKAALTAGTDAAGNAATDAVSKYSMQGGLKNAANHILASQYGTISKPVARQTRLIETIGTLADRGITKPGDAERIAQQFTGGNGLVSNAVTKAIGNKATIDVSDLGKITEDLATEHMLNDTQIKALNKYISATGGKLATGKASDAMDAVRRMEGLIADRTGKGGIQHLPTADDGALAKVMGGVADTIKDRVYSQANVKSVLTPELQKSLVALHPGNKKWVEFVNKDVMGAKDVGQLRKAQSAFVKVGKAIDEGDVNAVTMGGKVGNSLAGGALGQALNAVAGSGFAKRTAAGALTTAGDVAGSGITRGTIKGGMALGAQGGERAALSPFLNPSGMVSRGAAGNELAGSNSQDVTKEDPFGQSLDPSMGGTGGMGGMDASGQSSSPMGDMFSDDNLKMLALSDIQRTGGKNLDKIMTLGKLFGSSSTTQKPISSTAATQIANARSGLASIDQLDGAIQKDPGIINRNSVSGLLGNLGRGATNTQQYEAAKNEIIDVISRSRSGAALTASELKVYKDALPKFGDSKATAEAKLARFRNLFNNNLDLQGQTGPDPSAYTGL